MSTPITSPMAVGQLIGPPATASAGGAHTLKARDRFDDLVEVPAANGPQVTGTPVGCACGDGVIDWARVIGILRKAGWSGVLSAECGSPDQALRSRLHLEALLG